MSVADDLVEAFQPFLTADLQTYLEVIGGMFAPVEAYVEEQGTEGDPGYVPGWGVVFDIDLCPTSGLPYLAQYVGERLPAGQSDSASRWQIRHTPNQYRGTPGSIARAAQSTMTGTGTVILEQRTMPDGSVDPNGDHFNVFTYASETPDPVVTKAAILSMSPADMVVNYQVIDSVNWSGLEGGDPSWSTLESGKTWAQIQSERPGASSWTF